MDRKVGGVIRQLKSDACHLTWAARDNDTTGSGGMAFRASEFFMTQSRGEREVCVYHRAQPPGL